MVQAVGKLFFVPVPEEMGQFEGTHL